MTPNESEEKSKANPSQYMITQKGYHVIKTAKRSSTFFSISEAEIEIYAQYSWLSSLFLTIFGVFMGFATGCYVAIIQTNNSTVNNTLWWLAGITFFSSIIFITLAIILNKLAKKNLKKWESPD